MKHIVFIVYDFYPVSSGIANAVMGYSKVFVNNGYSVTVISSMLSILTNTMVTEKKVPLNEEKDNIHIVRIPYPKFGICKEFFYIVRAIKQIQKVCPKPDLVFGMGLVTYAAISGIAGKLFKIRSMTASCGSDVDQCFSIHDRLIRWIGLKLNTIVCAANSSHKEKMVKISKRKDISHIPMPIPEEPFAESKEEIKERVGFEKHLFHIITAGRLVESRHGHIKGINYLLESLLYLPQCKLHIIGHGPLLSEYKNFVNKNNILSRVDFKEFLPRRQYVEYLYAGDAFILPSLHEGLPLCMIEAMYYKTPLIVTPVGGMKDYIINRKTGLFVEERNPQSIKKAVQELIGHKEEGRKMADNAYDTYQTCFSEQAILDRFNEFLSFEN